MKYVTALLIEDPQNDFCPGGTLAVPEADQIMPVLNQYIRLFSEKNLPILVSRDWHPQDSMHFKAFGGLWPPHCVQDTEGAAFHPDLEIPDEAIILSKGMKREEDGYSTFDAVDHQDTPFSNLIASVGVKMLYVGGIATDYCVRASVLDALRFGFNVGLLVDAIKGVAPDTAREALDEMKSQGAEFLTYEELSRRMSRQE